ncbi:MAG: hypothetical protein AAFR52_18880 [Pseudomonadota bacterium]
MRLSILPAALALATLVPATALSQQGLGRLLVNTGLVKSDFAALHAASAELYGSEAPALGDETIWQNTETGAHGTVEIVAMSEDCIELRHLFRAKGAQQSQSYDARRCKGEDGRWLIAPE